jgi:hypothetical protein
MGEKLFGPVKIQKAETRLSEAVFGQERLIEIEDEEQLATDAPTTEFIGVIKGLCEEDRGYGRSGSTGRWLTREDDEALLLGTNLHSESRLWQDERAQGLVCAYDIKRERRPLKLLGVTLGHYIAKESVFVEPDQRLAKVHRWIWRKLFFGLVTEKSATKDATETELEEAIGITLDAARQDDAHRAA